ncbi:MAG: spondin domain-containing protein [Pseudomonadota bacterium]
MSFAKAMPARKGLALAVLLGLGQTAAAVEVSVTVENLAPADGVYLTPVWLGFHDGSFDVFNPGETASPGLEAVAEDGAFDTFRSEFSAASPDGFDLVVTAPEGFPGAPVFDPGDRVTSVLDLDPTTQRFLSYAAMILPSNDAFVANGNPTRFEIFDENGELTGPVTFVIYGERVWDAGTEANTESDAAFFNQAGPNEGEATADGISLHPGFNGSAGNPDGTPVVFLGGTSNPGIFFDATAADFTLPAYQIARITVAPATVDVRVTVDNLRPDGGTFLTPVWIGAHDGSFDFYDIGAPASPGLEQIAEDGATDMITAEFAAATGEDGVQTVILDPEGFAGAPVFDPGSSASTVLSLDSSTQQFLSYASMVIPSNDAFIGNGNPQALPIFDESGRVASRRVVISNQRVRDAGTEVNNEIEAAFLNQTGPNMGEDENGTVQVHPGFNGSAELPDATPVNVLGGSNGAGLDFDATAADFSRNGQLMAAIEIGPVIDASFGGTWVAEGRDGEGLLIELVNDADPTVVVSYYSYAADGSGEQLYLIGSGPVINDTAIADLVLTDGATFGGAFNSDDVIRTPWGQVEIRFSSCTEATLELRPDADGFEAATLQLSRLTAPQLGSGGHCG